MTKKQLLDMIDKSTFKYLKDDKKILYDFYYPILKAALLIFPDKTEIGKMTCLDRQCFRNKEAFDDFVKSSKTSADDIKAELNLLVTEIQTWVQNRPMEVAVLADKQRKRRIGLVITSVIIIATIIATVILMALDYAGIFAYGDQLSFAFDGIGLITGLAFFLYERIDDSKSGKVHQDFEKSNDKKHFGKEYNLPVIEKTVVNINNSEFIGTVIFGGTHVNERKD